MFLRELEETAGSLKGAGPETVRHLAGVAVRSIADLLLYYPRDWEDRVRTVPIAAFRKSPVNTVVRVLGHEWIGAGGMRTVKIRVEDESGAASLVCFNRPFLEKKLVTGKQYRLWGRFFYKYGEIQASAFEFEDASENAAGFGRILPVYPLSSALTQGVLRRLVKKALDKYAPFLEDELPGEIIARRGLLAMKDAARAIHFPSSMEELEKARQTIIYGELFYLEIMVGKRALERRTQGQAQRSPARAAPLSRAAPAETAPALSGAGPASSFSPLQRRLAERLPFALTAGQAAVTAEINRDMDGDWPMARLLQGDVGSGKTLVSFLAALRAVESGGQAVIMAPTELLARQHAENAARLLEPLGPRIAFLTGNLRAAGRSSLLAGLAGDGADIAAGTHALFSRDVVYRDLRLVIIDEQHRFGVTQRSLIMAKGDHPHLLMMSATPIPRTLALTVFGDMDVSVIPDMPPGRKPVKTHLAREANEEKVYEFVRKELARGHQAYFVYPLIEGDGEGGGLKAASSMAEKLSRKIFPEYTTALLHSKIGEDEKQRIMDGFRRGDIHILAATSVVEVGVDVPNATCMVVEHAERFGLSALHQLRGRVGRGGGEAYCFLVYSEPSPENEGRGGLFAYENGSGLTEDGKARLRVMLENSDGFVIAEEDLRLRGPGQIAGTEQSGYLSLGLADPVRDAAELAKAREDAFAVLERDPALSKPESAPVAEVLGRAPPFSNVTL
ncbi:MAG: ATP-dependent DNA helicase RecG [Treponema sp.]|jgi:ATP-dependent DNA helicase RecG|nr:ATP-dependent DNA helicase RecG [Treponema sp.]